MNKSLSIDIVCKVLCDEGFLTEAQILRIRERAAEAGKTDSTEEKGVIPSQEPWRL